MYATTAYDITAHSPVRVSYHSSSSMCKPYRYIDRRCGHPIAKGWHHWVAEPCRVALFTRRDCWIPVNIPLAMIENRLWEGEDKPCMWCLKHKEALKGKSKVTGRTKRNEVCKQVSQHASDPKYENVAATKSKGCGTEARGGDLVVSGEGDLTMHSAHSVYAAHAVSKDSFSSSGEVS